MKVMNKRQEQLMSLLLHIAGGEGIIVFLHREVAQKGNNPLEMNDGAS